MKQGISSAKAGSSSNLKSESETAIGIGSYNSISSSSNCTGNGSNLMQQMSSKIHTSAGNGSGNNLVMMNQMVMMKKSSSSNMQSLMAAATRQKKIQKLCYDVRISIFCGILTLLFLRSCLGGGEMASPLDDLRQLQRSRHILFDSILISNTSPPSESSDAASKVSSDSSSASKVSSDSSSSSKFASDSSSASKVSSDSSSSSKFASDSSPSSKVSSDSSSSSKFASDSSSSSKVSSDSSSSSKFASDSSSSSKFASDSSSSSKFSSDSSSSSKFSSDLSSSSSSSSNFSSSSSDSSSLSTQRHHRSNLHHHHPQSQNYMSASSSNLHRHGIVDSPASYGASSIEPIIRIQLLLTPDSNPMSESLSCGTEQLKMKYHNLAHRSMENTMDYCRLHRIEMHYSYVNNHHHHSNNRKIQKYNPRDNVLDRDAGPIDNYDRVMAQKLAHIYRAVKQAMDSSLRFDYEEELGEEEEEEEEEVQEGESGDQDSESLAEGTELGILAESRPKYNRSSDHIEAAPARGPATSNWIWWIDADDNMLVFTNMSMGLQIGARYGDDYNIVVFSDAKDRSTDKKNSESEADAYDAKNERVTSLLIRPCQWSLDVLDLLREQLMASASAASAASSSSSSSTMHRSDTMEKFFLRSTPSPSWNISSKLYLESSSSSSLYGVIGSNDDPIAEKSVTIAAAKDQPLLTHFKSCHPRSVCLAHEHDRSNADQCPIHLIEKAFEAARAQARSDIAVPKQAITISQSRSHSSQII